MTSCLPTGIVTPFPVEWADPKAKTVAHNGPIVVTTGFDAECSAVDTVGWPEPAILHFSGRLLFGQATRAPPAGHNAPAQFTMYRGKKVVVVMPAYNAA